MRGSIYDENLKSSKNVQNLQKIQRKNMKKIMNNSHQNWKSRINTAEVVNEPQKVVGTYQDAS